MEEVISRIHRHAIIPVVKIDSVDRLHGLASALLAAGLPCMEITFRTRIASAVIQTTAEEFPEILVGAGTVLSMSQVDDALSAGANFIVTPGYDEEIVDYCVSREFPIIPGIATPTELNMALSRGLSHVKFFPAEILGGVQAVKALSSAYADVQFVPTGGINGDNLADYLRLPSVIACGGSWLVKSDMISKGEFDEIGNLVRQALDMVSDARKEEQSL
jgi:2-dehydro-3-deoxyphosphogluconate aldolase/(4S)-4-hydroxy-2-oxoglutarate aldolase